MARHNLPRISGWHHAQRWFNNEKKVRSSKWGEDERPLITGRYRAAEHRFRLRHNQHLDTYEAICHSSSLITWYPKDEDGHYRTDVWLPSSWDTQVTREFLWRVGHFLPYNNHNTFTDTNGDKANMLLMAHPHGPSCVITVDEDDRLVREKSKHLLAYKRKATPAWSAAKTAVLTSLAPMIDLAVLRVEEKLAPAAVRTSPHELNYLGRPFSGGAPFSREKLYRLREGTASSTDIDAFLDAAREVYVTLYAKRRYRAAETPPPPTADEFRKSLESQLVSFMSSELDRHRRKQYLPMFEPFKGAIYNSQSFEPEPQDDDPTEEG